MTAFKIYIRLFFPFYTGWRNANPRSFVGVPDFCRVGAGRGCPVGDVVYPEFGELLVAVFCQCRKISTLPAHVTQAASMFIAMEWTELKPLGLLTWSAWVTFLYNALMIFVLKSHEEFWEGFQPAFVTLPLLLAVDLKSI